MRIKFWSLSFRHKLEYLLFWLVGGLSAVAMMLFAGCVYRGAKVTEGTDLAIGINVPASDGTLQLQVLNYLSGFRLGVDRNAALRCQYTVSESNTYFGVVSTRVTKTVNASVEPCADDSSTNAVPATAEK